MEVNLRNVFLVGPFLLFTAAAHGQEHLTLKRVLDLARQKNGTISSARFSIAQQRAQLNQSRAAFLPTVTPTYGYQSSSQEFNSQIGTQTTRIEQASAIINANWRLLDAGQRALTLRSARSGLTAQEYTTLQTERQILVNAFTQYVEVLRNQEQQRVVESRLERVKTIQAETEARVKVGLSAAKDILQSKADVLNAQVDLISARNNVIRAKANLKSIMGWDPNEDLPMLDTVPIPEVKTDSMTLAGLLKQGEDRRPDLLSNREQIKQLQFQESLNKRNAGVTWSLDGNFSHYFSPNNLTNRSLTFSLSYPLFDGNLAREQVRESRAQRQSREAALQQTIRQAKSEIEASFNDYKLNSERVISARAAYEAAELNYRASVESRKAGAGSLLEVLTAQVSLATADANLAQATYDFAVSDVNLKFAIGEPVPGEL